MAKSLQSISNGVPRNYTAFGQSIRKVASRLLPEFLRRHDCGFQDGGCQIFAEALHIWSRGELRIAAVIASAKHNSAQHIVAVTAGGVALDSDGAAAPAELLAKMRYFEGDLGFSLRSYALGSSADIPRDAAEAQRLAEKLLGMLGEYSADCIPNIAAAA